MNVALIVVGICALGAGGGLVLVAKLRALRSMGTVARSLGSAVNAGLQAFSSGPDDEDLSTAASRGLTAMATKGVQVQDTVRRFGPLERMRLIGKSIVTLGAVLLAVGIVLSFV